MAVTGGGGGGSSGAVRAGRAFVEVEHRGKTLHAFWTDAAKTQATLTVPVTEEMRGGFTVRTTAVRENRGYLESRHVTVPWSNKTLAVKWETFRSKLEPGKRETFTAVVTRSRRLGCVATRSRSA